MNESVRVKILFVCLGNICRSPTAQGVMERCLEQHGLTHAVEVDSAGTHAFHQGKPADSRAQQAALRRGADLSQVRARQVTREDFERFDYILAMDADNLALLKDQCPPEHIHKAQLLLDYAPDLGQSEVPDPYYGGDAGFERVLDLVEAAAEGLLTDIRRRL